MARSATASMSFKVMEGCGKGKQLYHEYADYTVGGTLLEYGFINTDVVRDLSNVPAAITLDLTDLLPPSDPLNNTRLQVLEQHGLLHLLRTEFASHHVWADTQPQLESGDTEGLLIPEELWAIARVLSTHDFEGREGDVKTGGRNE
eukprot:CAMPEP_0196576762 /NCGR_PEP_ID=MMETSP1081-20130531/5944_1 /TAXON_ID=36882 /ORGANISM="Pyramimonas amylifera, Strain CCMP720" /LENGTH=145 /DNA_ID=CAMNT_0041895455 /DNA_START=111 /DNA_END=545 /DNA_ORIENTATION=-